MNLGQEQKTNVPHQERRFVVLSNEIKMAINGLKNSLVALEERLGPILTSVGPISVDKATNIKEPAPPMSEFEMLIKNTATEINRAEIFITALVERATV
jgi:hypothetical protein